jgi:hypothetical protein
VRRVGGQVVVLSRDSSESASMAAGGMLAPQAERLHAGEAARTHSHHHDRHPSQWRA